MRGSIRDVYIVVSRGQTAIFSPYGAYRLEIISTYSEKKGLGEYRLPTHTGSTGATHVLPTRTGSTGATLFFGVGAYNL